VYVVLQPGAVELERICFPAGARPVWELCAVWSPACNARCKSECSHPGFCSAAQQTAAAADCSHTNFDKHQCGLFAAVQTWHAAIPTPCEEALCNLVNATPIHPAYRTVCSPFSAMVCLAGPAGECGQHWDEQ
jgi:hypothetical protein